MTSKTTARQVRESWDSIEISQRLDLFKSLPRHEAEELFLSLSTQGQLEVYRSLSELEKRTWVRLLPPDDVADLIQKMDDPEKSTTLVLLDFPTRREVEALLYFKEDQAGGLMNPRFIRLRPDVSCEVALRYYRMQSQEPIEFIDYAFVLDQEQKLLGIVTLRDLISESADKTIREIMKQNVEWVYEDQDQEEIGRKFISLGLNAIPVCDRSRRMKGVVTVDDIMDVLQEEASEDIQKLGGSDALEQPYLDASVLDLLKKRAGWLLVLFLGQMLTANAMTYFAEAIASAVVLAIFIPLIISSGGNSGSQAASLIIRSLALRELQPKDWFKVFSKEVLCSLCLGIVLGLTGLLRIALWPTRQDAYGSEFLSLAYTVGLSVLAVVMWGSLVGSLLPLLLKRLRMDPAAASAPLVATSVDVVGIIIYFCIAGIFFSKIL